MEYHGYEVAGLGDPPSTLTGPKWRVFVWPVAAVCIISVPTMLAFPSLMYANGGAAFLVPFGACTLLLLAPMVFAQVKLGGVTNSNVITMFGRSIPILKGVGVAMMIYLAISSIVEAMTAAYSMLYAYHSISGNPMPWSKCDNEWNTPRCAGPTIYPPSSINGSSHPSYTHSGNTSRNVREVSAALTSPQPMTPAEEYFKFGLTRIQNSEGFGDFGDLLPLIAASLGILWFIVFLITCWGPRIYGWLIVILTLGSFSIMFLLVGRGHEGLKTYASDGMEDFYRPTWDQLKNYEAWLKGYVLAVSLTGVVHGTLPTFGKFVGYGKCTSNSSWLAIVIYVLALPNIFVIMLSPFVSFLAKIYAKPFFMMMGSVEKILFHNIPDMTAVMPNGILGFFFFLWIILQSIIRLSFVVLVIQDAIVEGFRELLQRICSRKFVARLPICAIICLFLFLLGLPLATEGGLYLAYLVVWFSTLVMGLTYLLACIGFVITYVKQTRLSLCQRVTVSIVFCFLSLLLVGVTSLVAYKVVEMLPLKMPNGYHYPQSSTWFGWLVAGGPLLFGLVAGVIHALVTANGSCLKRLAFLLRGAPVPKRRTKRRDKVVMRPVGGLSSPHQPLMNKSSM